MTTAMVTGASSGIGRAMAVQLAGDGHGLVLVARSEDRLQALAAELRERHGVSVEVLAADLQDPAALARVEQRCADGLDLLVNNAGYGVIGSFWESDRDSEAGQVHLNVLALLRLTHAALPAMVARGRGQVLLVSSVAGFQPVPSNATYSASKAFVTSFGQSLSEELRGTGVTVTTLCPGFTRTEFQERAGVEQHGIPGPLWMSAEEVAAAGLAAVRRGRALVTPGLPYLAIQVAAPLLPRSVVRRIGALVGRQTRS